MMAQLREMGAVEITVLSSNGMHPVMHEMMPEFERATACKILTHYATGNKILKRVQGGETADVLIAPAPVIDELIRRRRVEDRTCVNLARSQVGLAVRAGAPRPEIGSVDALKQALLRAKSVTYTGTGASGIHFANILERLGISDAIKQKARIPAGGLVGELVARGEADIAVQQISELMTVAGIDLVGPLPAEVQNTTLLVAGVFTASPHADAAQALIAFLSTPAAARVFKANGMEPG
jgi:molybdate transport system substrate-binding protein